MTYAARNHGISQLGNTSNNWPAVTLILHHCVWILIIFLRNTVSFFFDLCIFSLKIFNLTFTISFISIVFLILRIIISYSIKTYIVFVNEGDFLIIKRIKQNYFIKKIPKLFILFTTISKDIFAYSMGIKTWLIVLNTFLCMEHNAN